MPALNPTEALSFLLLRQFLEPLVPASLLDQLAPNFGMAEQCLMAQDTKSPVRSWLKKVAVVPAWQPLLPAVIVPEAQAVIHEALLQNKQVRLRYLKRGDRSEIEYVAQPLGLVQRGGVIYLVATLFDYPDVRLLVLHRVRKAEMLDVTSNRPNGFNMADYVAAGNLDFGRGDFIDLVVRFTRDAGEHLWDTPLTAEQQIIELGDGRLEVRARIADSLQMRWWLLGFAEKAEVMAPATLRKEFADRLRRAAAVYPEK